MDSYYLTLALYILMIYWLIVLVLDRKGLLQRYNITAFGPVLMIRTKRGRKLLERMAKGEQRKRFWRYYANVGTVFVLIAMSFMCVLVVLGAYATLTVQPEPTELHEPRNWLLIPGLNEFIPMCAWIGFVVALVVHELSHAVVSIVEKIKVKSMGLLVAVVPIGAFAEPDSEQLFGERAKAKRKKAADALTLEPGEEAGEQKKVATARERTRILSAGVTSNFFVALIAFALFFSILFAVQPVSEGVAIVGVVAGFPAANAGVKEGMSIIRMDSEPISDYGDFFAFMNSTTPGQVVEVHTRGETFNVRLDKHPHGDNGFLGVTPFPTREYLENLRSMPSSLISLSPGGWLLLTAMPFFPPPFGFRSFNPLLSHLYEPVGAASFLGGSIFIIADVLFWTGWINFYVGLFNCLPMFPLDGFYVFREVLKPVLRLGIREEKKERFADVTSLVIALGATIVIIVSIVIMVAGPRFM